MKDSEFLAWLKDRLILVHHDPPHASWIVQLEQMIRKLEDGEFWDESAKRLHS